MAKISDLKEGGVDEFHLAEFLPYQLSRAANAVSSRIAQVYRTEFALSVPEWRVMATLGDSGEATQRMLVARIQTDKVAVNRACKRLEARQLIRRLPNAADGRSHLLDLTPEGLAMHDAIVPRARAIETDLLAQFNPADEARFRATLTLIGNLAQQGGAQT